MFCAENGHSIPIGSWGCSPSPKIGRNQWTHNPGHNLAHFITQHKIVLAYPTPEMKSWPPFFEHFAHLFMAALHLMLEMTFVFSRPPMRQDERCCHFQFMYYILYKMLLRADQEHYNFLKIPSVTSHYLNKLVAHLFCILKTSRLNTVYHHSKKKK